MAVPDKIYAFNMQPGVQSDGTIFSSKYYTASQWCRWYRGLPQKMLGFRQICNLNDAIPRGLFVLPDNPYFNVYTGDANSLTYFTIDSNGNHQNNLVDRTPLFFAQNPNNLWQFDIMFSTVDDGAIIVATAGLNLAAIDNTVATPVYYGDAYAQTPLQPTGFTTAGGIVALHPYLFIFDAAGNVTWTNANDPTTELGSARVTASKIVAGLPTRGGNSSPAGLLWSLDALIRVTQVGTTEVEFAFDTVTSQSSILSSEGVIEYDGVYYWAATDRFLFYDGIVRELPNSMSLEYFFNNLNFAERQKVWAEKITFKGEIWWHFPTGNNTECDHALIFNVREQCWYNTAINRSCGYYEQTFNYPIWAGNQPNESPLGAVWSNQDQNYWANLSGFTWKTWPSSFTSYSIWMHEIGYDENVNGQLTAIPSYFQSGGISNAASDPNGNRPEIDRWVYLYRFEPDFIQQGNLTLVVLGQEYARSPFTLSTQTWAAWSDLTWGQLSPPAVPTWLTWGDYVFTPSTIKIDMREQRREMYLQIISNTIGGYYEMGQCLMVARIGDARQ